MVHVHDAHRPPDERDERDARVRRVLWITLGLNAAVATAKLWVGAVTHVLSVTADGAQSGLDGLNNVLALVILRFATKAPDADHPYGHRKIEHFATLAIALAVAATGVGLAREAYARFGGASVATYHPVGLAVVVATLVVNVGVAFYEARAGRALGSALLVAEIGRAHV